MVREREKKSQLTIGKNCLGDIRLSFNQAPSLAADAKSGAGSASGDRENSRWDKAHRLPDSLELDGDNRVLGITLGVSGGESQDFGLNGVLLTTSIDNTTIAQVDDRAIVVVGNNAVDADEPSWNRNMSATWASKRTTSQRVR